jgi:hypothetical protein
VGEGTLAAAVVSGVGDFDPAAVGRHHRLFRADTVKPRGQGAFRNAAI